MDLSKNKIESFSWQNSSGNELDRYVNAKGSLRHCLAKDLILISLTEPSIKYRSCCRSWLEDTMQLHQATGINTRKADSQGALYPITQCVDQGGQQTCRGLIFR